MGQVSSKNTKPLELPTQSTSSEFVIDPLNPGNCYIFDRLESCKCYYFNNDKKKCVNINLNDDDLKATKPEIFKNPINNKYYAFIVGNTCYHILDVQKQKIIKCNQNNINIPSIDNIFGYRFAMIKDIFNENIIHIAGGHTNHTNYGYLLFQDVFNHKNGTLVCVCIFSHFRNKKNICVLYGFVVCLFVIFNFVSQKQIQNLFQ